MCVHVCMRAQGEEQQPKDKKSRSPDVSPLTPGVLGLLSRKWQRNTSSELFFFFHLCCYISMNWTKRLHFIHSSHNEKVSVHINTECLTSLVKLSESWGRAAERYRGCPVQNSLRGPLLHGVKPKTWTSEIRGQQLTNFCHRQGPVTYGAW